MNNDILDSYFTVTGSFDLIKCTDRLDFNTVLDVGFGKGGASLYFASKGKKVTSIGLETASYGYPEELFREFGIKIIETDLTNFNPEKKFDAILLSHVLEHVLDTCAFLTKAKDLLTKDGWLFVKVPPYKPEIVGGHICTGWNIGSLMYTLLLCGFDIKNGHFIKHGYNICGFVKKANYELPKLCFDNGDIERTKHLWPIEIYQGFNGNIDELNWYSFFDGPEKRKKSLFTRICNRLNCKSFKKY